MGILSKLNLFDVTESERTEVKGVTIKRFVMSPVTENTYVVNDETGKAVIIDCGCFCEKQWKVILQYCADNKLSVAGSIVTHAHSDHFCGIEYIHDAWNVETQLSGKELQNLDHYLTEKTLSGLGYHAMPHYHNKATQYPIKPFAETSITFGNCTLNIIPTPGHSSGSVSFHEADRGILFTGDALFYHNIGRTDLYSGSNRDTAFTLSKLINDFPIDTTVFTGHGQITTIEAERAFWKERLHGKI